MSATDSAASDSSERTAWSRAAERGSLLGLRITVACYRLCGYHIALALVHAVVAYFFLTDRRGRAASRAYLERVYRQPAGARALPGPPSTWLCFQHYRAFALSILDRMALWFGRDDDFAFTTEGCDYFDRLASEGRGAIVVGAHLGSFDALRLLARQRRIAVNVVMYTRHAARINRVFRELAPEAEARVIQVDPDSTRTAFQIRACVERGEIVAILADRVEPADRGRTAWAKLLGDPVELPRAPFLLASVLACPVALMVARRSGPGRYEVFAEELAERVPVRRAEREARVEALVEAYARRLEEHVLAAPLQWFNFYDYWGDAGREEPT